MGTQTQIPAETMLVNNKLRSLNGPFKHSNMFVNRIIQAVPALRNFTFGKGKEREMAIGEASEHLKTLENELGDKKFFGGEDIGLVDIVANVVGIWFGVLQELSGLELLTEEKFPKLCKWIHEYVNHTAIKEDVPPRDKLIEFYSAGLRAASK